MAGKKEKRSSRKANYYKVQAVRTAKNKARRQTRVLRRLALWVKRGVKKNGKPVMTEERRAELRVLRRQIRDFGQPREARRRQDSNRRNHSADNKQSQPLRRHVGPDPDIGDEEGS